MLLACPPAPFPSRSLPHMSTQIQPVLVLQVVIGIGDPNPLVSGSGAMMLRGAGIEVVFVGKEEAEASYAINRDFMQRMQDEAKLKSGPAASSVNSAEPIGS